jgi:predicted small metal-binding protein
MPLLSHVLLEAAKEGLAEPDGAIRRTRRGAAIRLAGAYGHRYSIVPGRRDRTMKDFHCRDVGMNCEFVARGDSTEDVLQQTARHAEQVHHMTVSPELEEQMKRLIHDQTADAHRESVKRNS